MKRRNFLKTSLAAGIGLSSLNAEAKAKTRPNILLLVSEDNGPELGCYGDPYVRTPNLDQLAADGVRFENAFVPYSVCSPSRACLFTGLYPHQNGQIGLATHKYAMYEHFPNIPSLLKGEGYRTGIIGKLHVNPYKAFPFDFKWNPSKSISFSHRNVEHIAQAAGEFINEDKDPFFLMVNFPDAHFPLLRQQAGYPAKPLRGDEVKPLPWVGADSERLREFTADYYNCLMRLDDGVGLVLDKLKEAQADENTIIIYMGDHGAQFSRGKTSTYDAGLRVPMMIRWPDQAKAGHVSTELVSSLDILPTLLKGLGLDGPENLAGRPLQPLLNGEAPTWRSYIYGQRSADSAALYHPQRTVRDHRYRLIENLIEGRKNILADLYATHHNAHFAAGTEPAEIAASS